MTDSEQGPAEADVAAPAAPVAPAAPSAPAAPVSLPEGVSPEREAGRRAARELLEMEAGGAAETDEDAPRREPAPDAVSLGDGVALVRRALAQAATPPRWPMYPRQFKQFIRSVQPDFDERTVGSIAELMRACQKDGILRLERDRQGALRVFANSATARTSVPHGWGLVVGRSTPGSEGGQAEGAGDEPNGNIALPAEPAPDAELAQDTAAPAEPPMAPPVIEDELEADDSDVNGNVAPGAESAAPTRPRRPTRARKTAAKRPAAARKRK